MKVDSEVETSESNTRGQNSNSSKVTTAFVALVFVVYAARMFLLISRYAVNIFFSDQWDFNEATLFHHHSLWQIFTWQHGPHRQGVGGLFEKLVDPMFLWNSRTESFFVGGVIVAAAIATSYLKRRLFGGLSITDVVIPALFFTSAQWETLFVTANFAHGPFPLLLVVLYCLSWTCSKNSFRYPLILITDFLITYTGFGLFLGLLTPFLLVLDYWTSPRGRPARLHFAVILFASLAVIGSFFIGYRFNADLECFSFKTRSPASYLNFVGLMFANFLAVRGPHAFPRIIGILILAAVIAALGIAFKALWRPTIGEQSEDHILWIVIVTLIAYTLLFCANTAYGRICGGLWMALAPRYAIYLEPAFLGVYFLLLRHQGQAQKWLIGGFLLAIIAASLHVDRVDMAHFRDLKQQWKTCYLKTEDVQQCNQLVGSSVYVHSPEQTHLQEKLQFLKQTRQNLYADLGGN